MATDTEKGVSNGPQGRFVLSQELSCHSAAVRCVCVLPCGRVVTGGLDGLIIVWEVDESPSRAQATSGERESATSTEKPWRFSPERQINHHTGFVYCVTPSKDTSPTSSFRDSFFSGGRDSQALRISSNDGALLMKFQGHEGPVCAALEKDSETLITGGWDGSAIIWYSKTGEIKHKLKGHSHAVCLGLLPSGDIITGSQDKTIRLWDGLGSLKREFPDAHKDIIRSLDVCESGVLSGSNDELLRFWSFDGALLSEFSGHSSFVFDVKFSTVFPGEVYSTSEDRCLKVWSLDSQKPKQSIPHNATVWAVAQLPNGDLATCCEDKALRIWTRETTREAPEEEREAQRKEAEQALEEAAQKSMDTIDVSNLPDTSQLLRIRGKKLNETKIFRDGPIAVAYQWNGGEWIRVGEVLGARGQGNNTISTGTFYSGDQFFPPGKYDFVFDVELSPGAPMSKLPYNRGDNVLVVAEKFCSREGIGRSSVEQITAFIRQNTGGDGAMEEASMAASAQGATVRSVVKQSKHFPVMQPVCFETTNWDQLEAKILENNKALEEAERMTELEMTYFEDLMRRVKSSDFRKVELKGSEMDLMYKKFGKWPTEQALPVLDLWRIFALHRQSNNMHKGTDDGSQYIACAIKHARHAPGGPIAICCFRYLANLFFLPTNRAAIMRRSQSVLEAITEFASSEIKAIQVALTSIILNFAVGLEQHGDHDTCIQVVKVLESMMTGTTDPGAYYRLEAALGTMLSQGDREKQTATRQYCLQHSLATLLPPMNQRAPKGDARVDEAAQDVHALLDF